MNLYVIHTGMFKLDGGAMFGVVPKSIWNRLNPADENNLCSWAMRCLLIEDGNRLILIDTGIGDKQSGRFFSYYYLHGDQSLNSSLQKAGFHPDDITDVFHTHLHFDHCGGAVRYRDGKKQVPELTFKNAIYWTNEAHWAWAVQPNAREKASFLQENLLPVSNSGQMKFVSPGSSPLEAFDIILADGHTEQQMLPKIRFKGHTLVFVADLLPSAGHIPLPYIMSYDVRPLVTMKEKSVFLQEAVDNEYILYFEHDPVIECAVLKQTDKGPRLGESFGLADI